MRPLLVFALAVSLTGCLVGPNYHRPQVAAPPNYRGPDSTLAPATADSLGDAKWWTVFQDPQLQTLVRTALQQNYNLRIAASRVLQARAQVTVTRANQFPTVSAGPQINGLRSPNITNYIPSYTYNAPEVAITASWDLDFWGKYRRATEAARATLLATEWGRRAVVSSLVADVANSYFQLRELDLQLEISKNTLKSRQESVKLTQTLEQGGAVSLLDVRQAEQLVETAAAAIPDLERQSQQLENQISILLGQNPGAIVRGLPLTAQALPADIPPGIPSRLLEKRPDIQQAEQELVAANAQIGVARAAYFPDISLTGTAGFESISLQTLFNGASHIWSYAGVLTQPIFEAGRLRANVRVAEEQRNQAVFTYQQTIQQAFSDVSNALIAYRKYREFREHEELLAQAAKSASDLAELRYKGGVSSYLEVLTNQTNAFAADLNLAGARLNERLALVQVYNALGGGWEQ